MAKKATEKKAGTGEAKKTSEKKGKVSNNAEDTSASDKQAKVLAHALRLLLSA